MLLMLAEEFPLWLKMVEIMAKKQREMCHYGHNDGNGESQKIFPSEELYLIKVAQFIWLQ